MKGKKELFLLLLGFGLFIFDLASDCYVAFQYKRAGEGAWFVCTLVFIIVPHFIINLMAMRQMRYISTNWCHTWFFLIFLIFVRIKEEFDQWKRTYQDKCPCKEFDNECSCPQCTQHREALDECRKSAYLFAWIRYVESYLESTPQLCLQVYIMLTEWSFPWYTVLSATISLLSLAWSNTALEKARLAKYGYDFSKKATALHFVTQLLVLTPRLFAIITLTYFTPFLLLHVLGISWVVGNFILGCVTCCHVLSAVCCGDTRCDCSFIKTLCKKLTLSLLLTFYMSETVLESLGFSSIFIKIVFLLIKSAENFFFTYLTTTSFGTFPHPSVFKPLVWSMVGTGFFFGALLLIIRHTIKRREKAVDDANATEAQIPESS